MRDSDWLKLKLRLIFLICVQTQILCNGAYISWQLRALRGRSEVYVAVTGRSPRIYVHPVTATKTP